MAENKTYTLLHKGIARDDNDDLYDIQLLRERLRQNECPPYKKEEECAKFKTEKEGSHRGVNIELPSGIDFRVEQDRIIISEFGLEKAQLKELLDFCYRYGIVNISLPTMEDDNFKKVFNEAQDELSGEFNTFGGIQEEYPVSESEEPTANNNQPKPDLTGLSDEELLEAKRKMAQEIKTVSVPKKDNSKKPSLENIRKYMNAHVNANQRYKSDTYKISSTSNGWRLMTYKDSDQKKDGPQADKDNHVNPNFQFGIIGEIIPDNKGNPRLSMTFLTPKYGDMEVWMWEEVMTMAKENGITHVKFNAGMQYKAKFFEACGKKMRIPTGVSLKYKDWKSVIDKAKENNDDLKQRQDFYKAIATQIKKNIRKENITNEGHPLFELLQDLEYDIRNEADINQAKRKYRRFNSYFDNNILDKFYNDNDNEKKAEPDAVKEIAGCYAYARFVAEFKAKDDLDKMDDAGKNAVYMKIYNEEVYKTELRLKALLGDKPLDITSDPESVKEVETKRNLLNNEFKKAEGVSRKAKQNIKSDLGVDIDLPSVQYSDYIPGANDKRVAFWKQHLEDEKKKAPINPNNLPGKYHGH